MARKKDGTTPRNIPIIALNAKAMDNDRDKCIQAAADEYASKPVNMNDLFAKMVRLTGRVHN
ncbi:MAG: hypothetical protein HQK62_07230 [Desulfamplus sp.]|nr:hypothetical protein [Desulfamplus sp.]